MGVVEGDSKERDSEIKTRGLDEWKCYVYGVMAQGDGLGTGTVTGTG